MSRPVDVLAVMKSAKRVASLCNPLVRAAQHPASNSLEAQAFNLLGEIDEASDAIAELLEADAAFDAATSEVSVYEALTPDHGRNYRTACYVQLREAMARRKSALARIRGAA